MRVPWPAAGELRDVEVEARVGRFQDLVATIRRLRADNGIPPETRMAVMVAPGRYSQEIEAMAPATRALARLETMETVDRIGHRPGQATAMTESGIEIAVQLGEVVDLDSQRLRLQTKLKELSADISRSERKLANDDFLKKAPTQIVEKERRKLAEAADAREKLELQLNNLQ